MSKKKLFDGDVFSAMTQQPPKPMPIIQQPATQPRQNFEPTEPSVLQPKFVQIQPPEPRPSVESGLPDGLTRATIIVSKELLEKCRDIAYWDRLRDQDVYSAALFAYVDAYEKRVGRGIDPRPSTARRTAVRK